MSLLLLFSPPAPQGIRRASWGQPSDEVTIYDRGGVNPRRLLVAQAACSWELSNAGMFSCFASLHAIQDAGLPTNLKGMWVEWESPAGKFGGVITGRPVTDGVAEIAAMSYAMLLRGRVVMFNVRPSDAPAGGIVRRIFREIVREHPTFLSLGYVDESGPPMAMSFAAQDVFTDILPALANDSGSEWIVTPDRVFHFSRYIGEDRSNSVRLVEGRHIASYRVGDDMWLTANSLIGVSASAEIEAKEYMATRKKRVRVKRTTKPNPRWRKGGEMPRRITKRKAYWKYYDEQYPDTLTSIDPFIALGQTNEASINQYGPIEAIRTYGDTRDMGTIEGRLERELDAMLNPAIALEMTLVDIDNCYRRFAEGDVVWVDIGSAALSGAFRVIHRSYDSGGLRIAGDLRPIGVI